MLRKKLLVVAMTAGLFVMGTGTAHAWDVIADDAGHGRVVVRAWTRGYNQVAYVADHSGTRVSVSLVVDCRNGDHFDRTWQDGGERFRFILRGLGRSGRCNHTLRVVARSAVPDLYAAVVAR